MAVTGLATAQQMAQEWVRSETDLNEVAKTLGYLTAQKDGREFFAFLTIVVNEGRVVIRSGKTLDYYREIRRVCEKYLKPYQDKPAEMAQILGWAVRLMRYYKVEPALAAPKAPPLKPKLEEARLPTPITGPKPTRIQEVRRGMVLQGRVVRIQPYGAFVDIGVGRDGLVHISELADRRVGRVEEVVSVGAKVTVRVKEVDVGRNRIGLSMKGMEQ